MQINEDHQDGAVFVSPIGRIDSTTSAALERHVLGLVTGGERRMVLDFERVDYISSAGLRVMLALARKMREHKGALVLCSMGEPVRQVFDLAGFVALFTIAPSRETALARLQG